MLTQPPRTAAWRCDACGNHVPAAYAHKCLEYDNAQAAVLKDDDGLDRTLAEAERLILDGHPSRALLRIKEARAALGTGE